MLSFCPKQGGKLRISITEEVTGSGNHHKHQRQEEGINWLAGKTE